MPSNVCSLTGEIIKEPAVSKKTGHLYEKATIVKHLNSFPYCPITNVEMSLDDLVYVQPNQSTIKRPQQTPLTILNSLKEEYDILVLQSFYLKKNIKQTKEELSHSLAANQASEKVIGRLLKERQQMERQIQKLNQQLA